ncbi:MAG: hypothetical protein GY792_05055 [Gammaproteobacteria bacterium]|nr:hypothetical protein [Gammaproteobacteria bacterium]
MGNITHMDNAVIGKKSHVFLWRCQKVQIVNQLVQMGLGVDLGIIALFDQ